MSLTLTPSVGKCHGWRKQRKRRLQQHSAARPAAAKAAPAAARLPATCARARLLRTRRMLRTTLFAEGDNRLDVLFIAPLYNKRRRYRALV